MVKRIRKSLKSAFRVRHKESSPNSDTDEIWRPVPVEPFSHRYVVSNLGRVRNDDTKQVLALSKTTTGYLKVRLRYLGVSKTFKVHTLVAAAFHRIPRNSSGYVVNHINGAKTDNRSSNLEWISFAANVSHGATLQRSKQHIATPGVTVSDESLERWQLIDAQAFPDFSRKYEVSNFGRVINRAYQGIGGRKHFVPWHNLGGYPAVTLTNAKKKKTVHVHILTARSFLNNEDRPNNSVIDHIDSNKWNPSVANLRWVSISDNTSFAHGKLTNKNLEEISHAYFIEGLSQRQIADNFGIAQQTVSKIVRGNQHTEKNIETSDLDLRTKLSLVSVHEIREMYQEKGLSKKSIATHFGISAPQVGYIIFGTSWGWVRNRDGSAYVAEKKKSFTKSSRKLSVEIEERIVELYVKEGLTQEQIASRYHVSPSTVSRIVAKRTRR